MSKFTQKAIMATFLELLTQKSLDKITVKDIIETAGINRNTFYYYYENIYDLLEDIFRKEMEEFEANDPEDITFYGDYVRAMAIVMEHRKAIIHLYHSKNKEVLADYIERTAHHFVRRNVRKAAAGYDISESGIEYITRFYSYALSGSTMHWIRDGMPEYDNNLMEKISESFETTVDILIRKYMENPVEPELVDVKEEELG